MVKIFIILFLKLFNKSLLIDIKKYKIVLNNIKTKAILTLEIDQKI